MPPKIDTYPAWLDIEALRRGDRNADIAAAAGVSEASAREGASPYARRKRKPVGIVRRWLERIRAPREPMTCPPDLAPVLGYVPDRALAEAAGCSHTLAARWRTEAGIFRCSVRIDQATALRLTELYPGVELAIAAGRALAERL